MRFQQGVEARVVVWGWFPLLTLTSALGLLLVAYAFSNSRYGETGLDASAYPGLLLIFTPTVVRLLSPVASRAERIALICLVGICCYLIKVMTSPLYFSFFDEFLQWRTVDDIARSGHLFSENPFLPVSPYYSGLEIVTNAMSTLSGLDTFRAGLIVVGVARLLMIVSLFALIERLFASARLASIATMLYMTNLHFLFFDAQYSYESLALPLATFVLFVIEPHQIVFMTRSKSLVPRASNLRWTTLIACIALGALAVTHHVTDFFLDGVLLSWAILYTFMRRTPIHRSKLALTALFAVFISIASAFRVGNPVVDYLSSAIGVSLKQLKGLLTGTAGARPLFTAYTAQPTPLWERITAFSSVALVSLGILFSLLCIWRRYRSNSLVCTFGIMSVLYPASQALRFTSAGVELANRAAAFLFIPIAAVLALFITQFWPAQQLNRKQTAFISCAISVVFLGGVILGVGPAAAFLPGPYETIADPRSIEPEGIQAATWARPYLQPNNRIAADRINQVLMGTYGDQHIVSAIDDKVDVSSIFLSLRLGPNEISILRNAQVHYLVVDSRLTQSLPWLGFYYDPVEVGAFHRTIPIDAEAFTKFTTVPQINRVFDSGHIIIYDVGGLINASETP